MSAESQEERFYRVEQYFCPLCKSILARESRDSAPESMKLVHGENSCKRSNRVYYCPGVDLARMAEEFR